MAENQIKILLVDDDGDELVIIRDFLSDIEDQKYDIEWVSNLGTAREKIQSDGKYDVVLLDYFIGVHSGFDFLREMVDGEKKSRLLY